VSLVGARLALVVSTNGLAKALRVPVLTERPAPGLELPHADRSVDAVVLDDPLLWCGPEHVGALLRDCWRVSGRACLVRVTSREGAARVEALLKESLALHVERLEANDATLLVVHRPRPGEGAEQMEDLARQLREARILAARLRAELSRVERERNEARTRLEDLDQSLPVRIAENRLVRRLARPARKLQDRVSRLRNELKARGLFWPESFAEDISVEASEPDLPFAGVAARARPEAPEAFLAARPRTVSLCHPHWRGIRAATLEQNQHVVEVPGFETRSHALRLAGFLRDAGAENVVVNGYPPGTEIFAEALEEVSPQTRLFLVYHGTPALSYGEDVALQQMIELFERGLLHKLGFVKHGLGEYFRYRGVRAEWVMNRCTMESLPPAPLQGGEVQIGVFAPPLVHKNVETQLVAALLVPGARVHTIEPVRAAYLQAEAHRIVVHGLKPRPEFLMLLREMHAASYVSLVECYPMTVLESIFSGVVCVTSNTSVIFDDDPVLREALVVAHHDSPAAITRKLSAAIERREELVPRAQAHLRSLNVRAAERWSEFLHT
jgi:glycosyltransferase involved in cell wall biosynthesis